MQDNLVNLLFIDDDADYRNSLVLSLRKKNIRVTAVESAEDAVELLKDNDFDVIVSDIRLNGMSGMDLLAHVKKVNRHLPVILLTGYADLDSARKAVELHAYDYLVKSFDIVNELVNPVMNAVASYRLQNENTVLRKYYKAVIDNLSAGLASFDRHGNVELANESFNKIFKLDAGNLKEQTKKIYDDYVPAGMREPEQGAAHSSECIIDDNTIGNILIKKIEVNGKEKIIMLVSCIDLTCLMRQEKDILFKIMRNLSEAEIVREFGLDLNGLHVLVQAIQNKLRSNADLSFLKKINADPS